MRKILVLSIAFILLFSFAGCQSLGAGSDKSGNDNLEGSLEDILAQIFETAQLDDQFRDYVENGLFQTEITVENSSNYFNTEGIEFEAGLASEPMMQPSAFLLTLIRVKEGADVDKIKADIDRPDVRRVFSIPGNHGFDSVLQTKKVGKQEVCVYAINYGVGWDNTPMGCKTVTIEAAPEPVLPPSSSIDTGSLEGLLGSS